MFIDLVKTFTSSSAPPNRKRCMDPACNEVGGTENKEVLVKESVTREGLNLIRDLPRKKATQLGIQETVPKLIRGNSDDDHR